MGREQLPFKNFGMNGAFYSLMVSGHFLMESFRHDIVAEILPHRGYPTTLRREIIDIAVKIVKGFRKIILKTTQCVWDRIKGD